MSSSSTPKLDRRALCYMALLALQFGLQPILTRLYTPPGLNRSTVILVQECVKFAMAGTMLYLTCPTIATLYQQWSIRQWIRVALLPATLYAVQNVAALTAYQQLDALTFNVLNQTKTLSAALCCYLVMGRTQSRMQILALVLLLVSALVMERVVALPSLLLGETATTSTTPQTDGSWASLADSQHVALGVAPLLLASFLSGLAGALSQNNLQSAGGGRNPFWFSMELCAASALMLFVSLVVNHIRKTNHHDTSTISNTSWFDGWTLTTWIPIVTNAAGGIVVGLVTKYAGSVRKGFALIFGILLSGVLQEGIGGTHVRPEQVVGGVLAALSLYLHAQFPPQAPPPPPPPSNGVEKGKKEQ